MARPFTHVNQIWTARAADETLTWGFNVTDSRGTFEPDLYGMMKLAIQLTGFSGTLDFQASVDGGTTYNNIPYYQADTALLGARTVAQISYTTSSNYDEYIIPGGPWPIFRIVMTRTAGSITATLTGYEHDSPLAVGDKTGFALSAAGVDAIWDDPIAGHVTVDSFAWTQLHHTAKTITFTGAAGLGAVGNVPLFTVTGDVVVVMLVPFCTTDLAEAAPTATLALGVTGSTALFIAATTATAIDAQEFWVDTAPDPFGIAIPAALKDIIITADIVGTVAAQAVNGGVLRIDCFWLPLSTDGNVVAV